MANNFENKLSQSSNPLAFATNGQNRNNSLPTVIKTNESSLRVEYDRNEATSYLTYACDFTQASSGTHNLKWTFTPNHNTKGYIKNDGVKLNILGRMTGTPDTGDVEKNGNYSKYGLESGRGATANYAMPVEGGVIALRLSGVSYDCARGCTTNRLVGTTRYYKFPANPSIDEDGTGDKEISVSSFVGQRYTNTYSPEYTFDYRSDQTYLHSYAISGQDGIKDGNKFVMSVSGPIDYSPYDESRLKHLAYEGTNYAYIDSNIGVVKKGTCSGIYNVTTTTAGPELGSASSVICKTTNLSITAADNLQAKTNPRSAKLYITKGEGDKTRDANRFSSIENASDTLSQVTIYQDGGDLTVPSPSTKMSWQWANISNQTNAKSMGTAGTATTSTNNYNGVSSEISQSFNYTWKSNAGIKASVGSTLNCSPSALTQTDNDVNKVSSSYYVITCPDNTGSEITLELSGHTMSNPVNTQSRSLSGKFLITCENDGKGNAGSLSNELDNNSLTSPRKVPFTITQQGKTNPYPSFTITHNITPWTSNPDTSIYPSVKFNSNAEKSGQSTQTHTITSTNTQKILLTIPSARLAPEGATIDDKTSTIGGNIDLAKIPASGGTVDLPVTWNYTADDFHKGYIPARGAFDWSTYFPDIRTATNVTGTVANGTPSIHIHQPGNNNIEQGNYGSATISIQGVYGANNQASWGRLKVVGNDNASSMSCTRSGNNITTTANTFRFTANANKATITSVSGVYSNGYLKITHNGVSTSDREGYCSFVKNVGKLQYPNQTQAITNTLRLYYKVAGEGYGGKISISTSKASGSGGTLSVKSDIDLSTVPGNSATGKSFYIYDLVSQNRQNGSIDGSPFKVPNSVTVGASDTTYKVTCPAVTVSTGGLSTWNVYGKITGTVNANLNNTYPNGLTNGLITTITVEGLTPLIDATNYKFWWTPNDNKSTAMTSSDRTATIYCSTNTGGTGYVAKSTTYDKDGYLIKVVGGRENKTESRMLGTLSAAWASNTATSSVDVWQSGTGGGNIENSGTFDVKFYNCTAHLSSDTSTGLSSTSVTLTSSSPDDPKSVTCSVDTINWDMYSPPGFAPYFNDDKYIKGKDVSKTIGAFDNNIDEYIGPDFSSDKYYLRYYKIVKINNDYYSLGTEDIQLDESQVKIELTWSDGVTTGKSRHIQISASNPGTYTYTCIGIKISHTFTNKYDGKSTTLVDGIHNGTDYSHTPITWTFTVDSKHYYNS